jgi:hypothetical protein
MSTPIVEAPAPIAVPPVRPWYKKKHFIGYTAAILLSLGVGSASAGGTTTVTVPGPAPAPVTNTVTVTSAPAECGTALDYASQFVAAISTEHSAMGAAFTQAGADGDVAKMASGVTTAMKGVTDTVDTISKPMAAAVTVCRAAIK